jgi:hypothetical protein
VSREGCNYSYCDASCDYDVNAIAVMITGVLQAIEALHEDVVTVGQRVERIEATLGIEDAEE